MRLTLDRRKFLTGAGAALLLPHTSRAIDKVEKGDVIFASAFMDRQRRYGTALINEEGEIIARYPLPGRGHGIAVDRLARWVVTFSRRPGNFALAVDRSKQRAPTLFHTPGSTHFYGHGVFSPDGKCLFATENKFDEGTGLIGLYDATDSFKRIGEIPAYGVGPHEILLMPDGKSLCIANGGIQTHPDFGREKLNLATMQSSIAFIDISHGELIGKHDVPRNIHRLSLRHMAIGRDFKVWIGGQYNGAESKNVPVIACACPDRGLYFPSIGAEANRLLSHYTSSVASSRDGKKVAFSSSKGNVLMVLDCQRERVLKQANINLVSGVSAMPDRFAFTTEEGFFQNTKHPLYWDNHLQKAHS